MKTLEEIRNMGCKELQSYWMNANYPFDRATCFRCVTQHGLYCNNRYQHREFRKSAFPVRHSGEIKENLNQIYALRKFFANLYPWNPTEEETKIFEGVKDDNLSTVREMEAVVD